MKQDKPQLLLKHYLKKLKLPTMLRDYEALAATCAKDNCDYVSFLLRLVEREALDREKRAAERRVKNARFPIIKTLDTFDFKAQPSIKQKLVRELMVGQYADRQENVLLVGNSGTGKTHLASALGFAGCMQGRKVRFFTAKALVTQLMEMAEQRQLERTLKQLERQDILILDELGYVPFSRTAAELLFGGVSRPCGLQRAVNTEQALKTLPRKPTRQNNGEGRRRRRRDEKCILRFRRGSGGSTYGTDSVCNKGNLPGGPRGQRQTREGPWRPRQMADGPVVPWKPRNGG